MAWEGALNLRMDKCKAKGELFMGKRILKGGAKGLFLGASFFIQL